jgi:GTP-binding protein HflX
MVWNKIDVLDASDADTLRREAARQKVPTVCVSALTGEGLTSLGEAASLLTAAALVPVTMIVPFDRLNELQEVRKHGTIDSEEYTEAGVRVTANVPLFVSRRLSALRLS